MNNRVRSAVLITAGAVALYAALRMLPTGTNLEHADFTVPGGPDMLELCDPGNPQFLPAATVKSPVSAEIKTDGDARAGERVRARLFLRTAGGKQIGPGDLLVSHTQKLHLLVIDELLEDYHHMHPVFGYKNGAGERGDAGDGGSANGAWEFSFTPRRGGVYRVFCDFVPAATARPLYASVDLRVGANFDRRGGFPTAGSDVRIPETNEKIKSLRFTLSGSAAPGRAATLVLSADAPVRLEPVMDAYAHLVAFDTERSGFAHLHPAENRAPALPLSFRVTFPRAGAYVVWAQLRVDGGDVFVPFRLDVKS